MVGNAVLELVCLVFLFPSEIATSCFDCGLKSCYLPWKAGCSWWSWCGTVGASVDLSFVGVALLPIVGRGLSTHMGRTAWDTHSRNCMLEMGSGVG